MHYLQHNPVVESWPRTWVDLVGVATAWTVLILFVIRFARAWKAERMAVMLLGLYVFVNILAVVASKVAEGDYYGQRRYMFICGEVLLIWAGIEFYDGWRMRRYFVAVLLSLMLPLSVFHQWRLLHQPDEIKDYREMVRQLHDHGYRYGVTWYTYAFALTALSDEQMVFSVLDHNQHEVYERMVAGQDKVALVHPSALRNLPDNVVFQGYRYRRDGLTENVGELAWTPYRRTVFQIGN